MNKITRYLIIVLVLALGMSIFMNFHYRTKLRNIPRESYIDTTFISVPVPRDSIVVRYVMATLPVANMEPDTLSRSDDPIMNLPEEEAHDSVTVSIPITQKRYEASEYTAWVSGFHPSLDSLELHIPTTVITRIEKTPLIEWGVGFQAGGTWLPGVGVQPYLGVGVQIGVPMRKIFKNRKHGNR